MVKPGQIYHRLLAHKNFVVQIVKLIPQCHDGRYLCKVLKADSSNKFIPGELVVCHGIDNELWWELIMDNNIWQDLENRLQKVV